MRTFTFTEDQVEAIAYVIKITGCSFRKAYAACNMNNYNTWLAVQEIRKEQKRKNKKAVRYAGFNGLRDFGFRD